jgi:hypothetical protein
LLGPDPSFEPSLLPPTGPARLVHQSRALRVSDPNPLTNMSRPFDPHPLAPSSACGIPGWPQASVPRLRWCSRHARWAVIDGSNASCLWRAAQVRPRLFEAFCCQIRKFDSPLYAIVEPHRPHSSTSQLASYLPAPSARSTIPASDPWSRFSRFLVLVITL